MYRRTRPFADRPFSVPGYPLTPLLFIVAAAAIVLNTVIAQPGRALVGLRSCFSACRPTCSGAPNSTHRRERQHARLVREAS